MESKIYEIVFLIDASLANCSKNDHCNEVLLTVLRLLSNIRKTCKLQSTKSSNSSRVNTREQTENTSDISVKWGFKFFSTARTITRNRSSYSSFKSFKLTHLEDFERKMMEVFSAEKKEDTTKPKNKSVSSLYPAKLLSTALTETLHDFKWTTNDIMSPVNRKRNNFKLNNFARHVFVFTKAPCTKKSLRYFSNKMVLDSDIFIDSFMSPALLTEYQQKMNISLSCVDFSSAGCTSWNCFVQDEPTAESVFIVKETFRELGGYFVSKDMILCCVPTTDEGICDSHCILDSVQILSNFPSESILSSFQKNEQAFHEVEISVTLSCKSFQRLPINLTPVVLKQDHMENMSNAIVLPNELLLKGTHSMLIKANGKSKDECILQPTFLQQHTDLTAVHFTLIGCVPRAVLCDVVITSLASSFMLSCNDSGSMTSLLQQLAFSRSAGILSMTSRGKPTLMLALLQAQNGDIGFISLLNLCDTVNVEKTLLQHTDISFMKEGNLETEIKPSCDQPIHLTLMEKLHSDIQKLKSVKKTAQVLVQDVEQSQIFRSHCMNSWHVPGSTGQMSSLISKINDRLDSKNSNSQKNFMKQLQRHYVKERQPVEVIQNTQPIAGTPISGFPILSVGSSGESESGSRSSHYGLRHLRSSTLSRGRLMVNKARSANFTATEDENESLHSRPGSPERRRSSSAGLIDLNLNTEEDLKSYLHRQYDQVLSAGVAMETTIQTMVMVTSQFMSRMQFSNPQRSAGNFIHECLVLNSSKLKEKYFKQTNEENKSNKVTEYKLQIVLHFETESLLRDTDRAHHEVLNELVSMLRALSFLSGATSLTDFLADLVTSYVSTLPKLLVDIFDELMLPLPASLAKYASPITPSSVFEAHDISLLSAPESSQPSSHLSDQSSQQAKRSHKVKQHPSISDFRQKKQILVKPKAKVEAKKVVTDKIMTRASSSRARPGAEYERAKRNLFCDKSKLGHSKTKDKSRGGQRQKHSHSHTKTSRTLVPGTPIHKQTSQSHLLQQERRRRRENITSEVQVIAESPMKDDDDDIGDDTTLNRPARYIVRESFYSSKTQPSRNLARCLELVQKGGGHGHFSQRSSKSQGTLASAVRGESPMLSPRSRLLKSFLSSPSPTPKSKRKHKQLASTPLRRSPRKSVKRLVFNECDKKSNSGTGRPVETENAHLIFDGENANDFDLLVSPTLSSVKNSCQGYKTPEKRVVYSQQYGSDAASCPPLLQFTTSLNQLLNLSFRNILSSQDAKDVEISEASVVASYTGTSDDISTQPPLNNTPLKQSLRSGVLSSPNWMKRLRSPVLPENPIEASPVKVNGSFLSHSSREVAVYSTCDQIKKDAPCNVDLPCTPTKGNKVSISAQNEHVFRTPKKPFLSHITVIDQAHTTPSKVKFLDSCLISPPTGSGYPPSLEKSTPGKSILKNSPRFKGKVKRRIELQSVTAYPSRTSATFMNKNVDSAAWSPSVSLERVYNNSEIEMNDSTPLLGKLNETAEMCVHKPDSESVRNSKHQNVENRSPSILQCRKKQNASHSCESPVTELKDPGSIIQNFRSKIHSHMTDSSSSSEDSSTRNTSSKRADLPATVTILTPSAGNKPTADTINKWVRLKRSSPKNGTNSPSRLALSPAHPPSSNDRKLNMSGFKTHFLQVENSGIKNVQEEQITSNIKGKSRKRSLLFEDDKLVILSPSKRRKPESKLNKL